MQRKHKQNYRSKENSSRKLISVVVFARFSNRLIYIEKMKSYNKLRMGRERERNKTIACEEMKLETKVATNLKQFNKYWTAITGSKDK